MRPRRCRRTADPGSGCPCCSRSGPAARPSSSLWQCLAYRRFLAELEPRRARPRRRIAACRWSRARRSRGRSRSACSTGGSSCPADFESRYSPEERALALDHEASTTAAATSGGTISASLVLALNWFNPIAWLAFRAFRADQELACDAAVAAAADARRAPRLCARPGQIREPTRPDRRLPAQSCRPTETETEDDEDPQAEPPAHARRRRRRRPARRRRASRSAARASPTRIPSAKQTRPSRTRAREERVIIAPSTTASMRASRGARRASRRRATRAAAS